MPLTWHAGCPDKHLKEIVFLSASNLLQELSIALHTRLTNPWQLQTLWCETLPPPLEHLSAILSPRPAHSHCPGLNLCAPVSLSISYFLALSSLLPHKNDSSFQVNSTRHLSTVSPMSCMVWVCLGWHNSVTDWVESVHLTVPVADLLDQGDFLKPLSLVWSCCLLHASLLGLSFVKISSSWKDSSQIELGPTITAPF